MRSLKPPLLLLLVHLRFEPGALQDVGGHLR